MRTFLPIAVLASTCFSADPTPVKEAPKLPYFEPSLEKRVLNEYPHLMSKCFWVGNWENDSMERVAYAFGCFLASDKLSPVERLNRNFPDTNDFILEVDCNILLSSLNSLQVSNKVMAEFVTGLELIFDVDHFKQLIIGLTRDFDLASFEQVRSLMAQSARHELAIIAVDVAVLKWVVQSIKNGGNPYHFMHSCSVLDLSQHAILSLELYPEIARLCRSELDIFLNKLVAYYNKMNTLLFGNYVKILNIITMLDNVRITEKLFPIILSKAFHGSGYLHLKKDIEAFLFRYTRFRSFNNCPNVAKLLKERFNFQNDCPKLIEKFSIQIYADQDVLPFSTHIFPCSRIVRHYKKEEYVLQAEIISGKIIWARNEFELASNPSENSQPVGPEDPSEEHPHKLYVVCQLKPPPNLAIILIDRCQTEEGLKKMLKDSAWRHMVLAFGVSMFEAKLASE